MARPTLRHHRKFRDLARLLNSPALAWGSLELIWYVAYESGDELIGCAEDVEEAMCWRGAAGDGCKALVTAGFLDASPEGYRVHDLWDHAPDYVLKRWKRESERKGRARPPRVRTNGGQTADTRTTDGGRMDADTGTVTPAPAPAPTRAPARAPAPALVVMPTMDGATSPDEIEMEWAERERQATGVSGVRPNRSQADALIALCQRYPNPDDLWRRAELMWTSPECRGMTCNPKLLLQMAPALDKHINANGPFAPFGTAPKVGSKTAGNFAAAAAFAKRGA